MVTAEVVQLPKVVHAALVWEDWPACKQLCDCRHSAVGPAWTVIRWGKGRIVSLVWKLLAGPPRPEQGLQALAVVLVACIDGHNFN